ncbi:MAG TPA: DUF4255 domain-containing protein [Candidatus Binatia bacterium]
MATHRAIAATSQALLGLLRDACPRSEFPKADFQLYQNADFEKPMEEGISLYLYRVAVNGSVRNMPPRLGPDGRRYRPSLPVDLHYLLTAWAKDPEEQQRLLGWSIRALEDMPILPAGLLNYKMPETETFHPNETVELICEPLSLQDWTAVWDKLKPKVQTSMAYVVRMIAIESTVELSDGAPMQTRVFDSGKGPTP